MIEKVTRKRDESKRH